MSLHELSKETSDWFNSLPSVDPESQLRQMCAGNDMSHIAR